MKQIKVILLFCLLTGAIQAGEYIEYDKKFDVTPGGTLFVDLNPGSVIIKTWNKNEFEITVKNLTNDRESNLKTNKKNNNVYVKYTENWNWDSGVKIMINIPEKFNIEVNSTGGSFVLYNDLDGNLNVETSGGKIDTRDISGNVRIETAGGEIKTGDIGGKLNANTFGGDIFIGSIFGSSALVKTMGGNIDVFDVKSDIELETLGGDIDVGKVEGNITAQTAGGNIKILSVTGNALMETAGGDLRLNGANGKVIAETYAGDIILKQIIGEVNAQTNAGEIDVEIFPAESKQSFIKSSYGDVTIRIPENSDIEIESKVRISNQWDYNSDLFKIKSDFKKLRVKKDPSGKIIEGSLTLKNGSHKMKIKTNNSEIFIKKIK